MSILAAAGQLFFGCKPPKPTSALFVVETPYAKLWNVGTDGLIAFHQMPKSTVVPMTIRPMISDEIKEHAE
jgi:hypothetical protein